MRSEVLTAVKMSMLVFWVVTPYGLAGRTSYCLHFSGLKLEAVFFSETLVAPASPRGVTTQKTITLDVGLCFFFHSERPSSMLV
jgi:hypothetical protein